MPILALVPLIGFWFGFGFTQPRDRLRADRPVPDHQQHAVRAAVGRPGQHELFTLHDAEPLHAAVEAAAARRPCRRSSRASASRPASRSSARSSVTSSSARATRASACSSTATDPPRVRDVRRDHPVLAARPRRVLGLRHPRQPSRRPLARDHAQGTEPTRHLDSTTNKEEYMRKTSEAAWLAVPLAGFLFLAACGRRQRLVGGARPARPARRHDRRAAAATTGGGAATTAASGGDAIARRRLPRHRRSSRPTGTPRPSTARLYELVGDGYEVDTDTKAVTGAAGGDRRRGHRREDRDPRRRAGHRLPAGDGAALHRRLDPARLRLHRRGGAELGRQPDRWPSWRR